MPGAYWDAWLFKYKVAGWGCTPVFDWGNVDAWERDWRDCSLGGSDCTYGVDHVDSVYWAGHGNDGGIALPTLWAKGVNDYDAVNDKLRLPSDPPMPRPYPVAWYFWMWWNE